MIKEKKKECKHKSICYTKERNIWVCNWNNKCKVEFKDLEIWRAYQLRIKDGLDNNL